MSSSSNPLISEVSSKKDGKRGRPRKYNYAALDDAHKSLRVAKTRRGTIEFVYAAEVLRELLEYLKANDSDREMVEYFVDVDQKTSRRRSIMAALGRVEDEQQRWGLIAMIHDQRMTTARAVAFIRQVRTGKPARPNHRNLMVRIAEAVDWYCEVHPETTRDMMADALREVANTVEAP